MIAWCDSSERGRPGARRGDSAVSLMRGPAPGARAPARLARSRPGMNTSGDQRAERGRRRRRRRAATCMPLTNACGRRRRAPASRSLCATASPPPSESPRQVGGAVRQAGDGVVHVATVAAGQERAEHRDAQRAAGRARRVVDGRADARLGQRQRAHDRVGGRRHRHAHAEADHAAGERDEAVADVDLELRAISESAGGDEHQPGGDDDLRAEPLGELRRQRAADHEADATGETRSAGLERRVAEHVLQVLGEEEHRARTARRTTSVIAPLAAEKRGLRNRRTSSIGSRRAQLPGQERGRGRRRRAPNAARMRAVGPAARRAPR